MPHTPLKPCKHYGCANLTADSYCDEHKATHSNEYDKYCRREVTKNHYGKEWRKIRNEYITANPLCERCLKENRYTSARIVHHILPVSQGGTDDYNNLMSVCHSCHEVIHHNEIGDK